MGLSQEDIAGLDVDANYGFNVVNRNGSPDSPIEDLEHWQADKKKVRYDYRQDRANDVKRHDNPHHPSQTSHIKREQASREQLDEYYKNRWGR